MGAKTSVILPWMFTLDTNILIYYATGDPKISEFVLEKIGNNVPLIISTIVVAEFLSFPPLKPKDRKLFSKLLEQLQISPLTFEIAEKTGFLRRKYKILLADAAIAATTWKTNATLITRNIKHFQKIKEIKAQSI